VIAPCCGSRAQQQVDDGGLAGATGSHQRGRAAGRYLERHARKSRRQAVGIAERDVIEADALAQRVDRPVARKIVGLVIGGQHQAHRAQLRFDLSQVEQMALDLACVRLQAVQQRRRGDDCRQRRTPVHSAGDDHAQHHQEAHLRDRIEPRRQSRERERRPPSLGRGLQEAFVMRPLLAVRADRAQSFDRHQHLFAEHLMHLLDLLAQGLSRARKTAQHERENH
jgi:hypothetical protein